MFFCCRSFSASGSFPVSRLFASGGQRIGASALVLPMNIQLNSFKIDWFDLLEAQGSIKSFLQHNSKASVLCTQASLSSKAHILVRGYWKTTALTMETFVGKVMSLFFNNLSRFVIAFLPRNKCHLISWMQSPSSVILEPKKIKSVSCFPPSISYEVMEPDAMILVFLKLSFKLAFSLFSFTLIKRLFIQYS